MVLLKRKTAARLLLHRAWFATKTPTRQGAKTKQVADTDNGTAVSVQNETSSITLPKTVVEEIPTTFGGIAFPNDLRSTSALGLGDGIHDHTKKWLQGHSRVPLDYISKVEPQKVKGLVVASRGSHDPALGAPVEYISLKGTTYEKPAVCKYTGNKFYSDDWKHGGAH